MFRCPCLITLIYVTSELVLIQWLFSSLWIIFSCLFACLLSFYWMPDIENLPWWVRTFCMPINIPELCSGIQLSLQMVWSFWIFLLRFILALKQCSVQRWLFLTPEVRPAMFSTKCRLWWVPSALQDRQDRSQSIGQPMEILDMQSNLLPPQGGAGIRGFFACLFYMEHEGGAVVIACMLMQTTIFVLTGFQVPRICQVPSAHWNRWDRSSTLDRPQKSWNVGLMVQLFPSPGKSWELRASFGMYGTVPGTGIMVRECLRFSYLLWCGWFHACPRCRSLSTSFWISHKWNVSIYVVESLYSWEEGESTAFHSTILLMSPSPSLLNGNVDLLCDSQQMHRKHYELS